MLRSEAKKPDTFHFKPSQPFLIVLAITFFGKFKTLRTEKKFEFQNSLQVSNAEIFREIFETIQMWLKFFEIDVFNNKCHEIIYILTQARNTCQVKISLAEFLKKGECSKCVITLLQTLPRSQYMKDIYRDNYFDMSMF